MSTNTEIFKQFADTIVPEIKAVSKRFAESVGADYNNLSLEIFASPYINTLIDGRAPTREGAPKGNPTLQQILRAWIDDRNIVPRPNDQNRIPTLDQLSWAMAISMHRYGDLLYQRGGGNNIFDTIITEDRLAGLINLLGEEYKNTIEAVNFSKKKL